MKFEMQSHCANMLTFLCTACLNKQPKIGFLVNVTEEAVQNVVAMIIIVFFPHSHAEDNTTAIFKENSSTWHSYTRVGLYWIFYRPNRRIQCSGSSAHVIVFMDLQSSLTVGREIVIPSQSVGGHLLSFCLWHSTQFIFSLNVILVSLFHIIVPFNLSFVIWEKMPSLLHGSYHKINLVGG